MTAFKIDKNELPGLLTQWAEKLSVLVPTKADGSSSMAAWDGQFAEGGFLNWYRSTTVPAKNLFLPAMEELFSFDKNESGLELKATPYSIEPRLVFGIRPCDARALATLDNVFSDTYQDSAYLNRRKNTLLVGMGCARPYESCFCTSLGSGPADSSSVDIMSTDIGESLLFEGISDRGKKLLKETEGLTKVTASDATKAKKAQADAAAKVTRQVNTEGMPEKLLAIFEDKAWWQGVAAKCVSCGICTLLCPTCYCFDINDEVLKGSGSRYRSLDSCSFPSYTRMPVENPRQEKWRRVRNKLCHKYEFYPVLFDIIACTGCGRCIRRCPVNWDISQVLNSVPAREVEKV